MPLLRCRYGLFVLSDNVPINHMTMSILDSSELYDTDITNSEVCMLNWMYDNSRAIYMPQSTTPLPETVVRSDIRTVSRLLRLANLLHIPDAVNQYTDFLTLAQELLASGSCAPPVCESSGTIPSLLWWKASRGEPF
jgi:hypothetical protein